MYDDHEDFVLPAKSKSEALKIYNEMSGLNSKRKGVRATAVSNGDIWLSFLVPLARTGLANLRAKNYVLGLGKIYGIVRYMMDGLGWLVFGEEFFCDEPEPYITFFKNFSSACRILFAQSNETLGIEQDGLREWFKESLERLELEINTLLDRSYHDYRCKLINVAKEKKVVVEKAVKPVVVKTKLPITKMAAVLQKPFFDNSTAIVKPLKKVSQVAPGQQTSLAVRDPEMMGKKHVINSLDVEKENSSKKPKH